LYTGVKVIEVEADVINQLYKESSVVFDPLWDRKQPFFQNQYVVVKSGESQSAVCRVRGDKLKVVKKQVLSGIEPRNKEQIMAMDALSDPSVSVVALTGRAGTGKTLLTMAAALDGIEKKQYDRIILTKPMTQVTEHDLGALPGEVEDKFGPYLDNYLCNFAVLVKGKAKRTPEDLRKFYNIDFIPMQLIRGSSWANSYIIADEVQTLNFHEMLTLGTRVSEGSKLVIMGDLNQRDKKIEKQSTGIYKFVNSPKSKNSDFVSSIELIKCERSETARLFADIFE
jgi:PhoH-like ATPase